MSFEKVDFPSPLTPKRPIRSSGLICKLTFFKTGILLYPTEILSNVINGGANLTTSKNLNFGVF